MQATKKLTWGAGAVVLAILIYSLASQRPVDYPATIAEHRVEVNDFMKNNSQSPLPDSLKARFAGLDYYNVDEDFKVVAELTVIAEQETLTLGTSDGETRKYLKYAYADFTLKDTDLRLLVLKSQDEEGKDYFFIPFSDLTSTEETYGGGRYLDLEYSNNKQLVIDFNFAYNPYCAYNPSFSCPLPPAENHLKVAIRAGERNFL